MFYYVISLFIVTAVMYFNGVEGMVWLFSIVVIANWLKKGLDG